eukprot:2218486-Karenia_brevis.AAC.1
MPPQQQTNALKSFDAEVRSTFCHVSGLLPTDQQWGQACRGLKFAGLGLRSCLLHAPAAYVASCSAAE